MTELNTHDLDPWPMDDRGWFSTYLRVCEVDDHLRYRSGVNIVIKGPPGTAGAGWAPTNIYPGVRAASELGRDKGETRDE